MIIDPAAANVAGSNSILHDIGGYPSRGGVKTVLAYMIKWRWDKPL